jgi:hemerythrin-like domain-containing protein
MPATVVERVLHDHGEMHARLSDWEAALGLLASPAFAESQRGLEKLWQLVPFFEKEAARHFREEETGLFPLIEAERPAVHPSLTRFAGEHAEFNRQWQAYKRELLYCDAVGETRRVLELGRALVGLLRQHMSCEEAELLPLVTSR